MGIEDFVGKIICGDNKELIKLLPNESIDLTVTSPPYDDLRDYHGFSFDVEILSKELYRVTKSGGIIVWIVCDSVKNGSETLSSFMQAIQFVSVGFNLYDTMIWRKDTSGFPSKTRYNNVFEYMFVFSKGKPKTINLICDKKNKWFDCKIHGTNRQKDGTTKEKSNTNSHVNEFGIRDNVWEIPSEKNNYLGHPAPFPLQLVIDHIKSWSNKGDIVLDPFMGSGTTADACRKTDRKFIGFEISKEYCDMAEERIAQISIFD